MEILPEPNAHPSELKVHEVQYTMADSTIASLTTTSKSVISAENAQEILVEAETPETTETPNSKDTTEVKSELSLADGSRTDEACCSNTEVEESVSTAIPDNTKGQASIVFVDTFGTRWTFPYEESKTWDGTKKLVKAVFATYSTEWLADYLDEDDDLGETFSITKTKPEQSNVLPNYWESLVSPGWEFKLEFTFDVLSSIRRQKRLAEEEAAEQADKEAKETDVVEELSKVSYVATYLAPDSDGDYQRRNTKRLNDKTIFTKVSDIQIPKSVIEEHREVYCSNKYATDPEDDMFDTISSPVLYIHSPILLNALNAIIDCQSRPDRIPRVEYRVEGIESDLGQGRLVYPFTDLHHYRERLLQYREEVGEVHDSEYTTTCQEHIDILVEYLNGLTTIGLENAELLWSNDVPKTTFTSLWLLLKPGTDVFVQEQGKLNAYVIESFSGGVQWGSPNARSRPYIVNVWNLNFDGQILSRSVKEVSISIFDGQREITSLPLFPIKFHVDEDPQNPLRQQLVDRGKRFVKMVKTPTFQEYSGPSRLQGNRTFKQTRVVVDHTSQPWRLNEIAEEKHAHLPIAEVYNVELGQRTREPKCLCKTCQSNSLRQHGIQRRIFDDYDNIDLSSVSTLTDHQYLLCWSHVYAYVLKDRVWDVLEVSNLTEPKIHKGIIDTLVMKPESNKQMIKAVCEIFGGTYKQAFSSDFIQGKGEGQILLLHGPPGTGKTLTAESVAEYTGRPLLNITAADLGHEPIPLEQNLLRFFRNARHWNAIVLLDEADVYLETRSAQDLRRNSIVSIFLRALDYFQGILFLTTNRVGSFDEAIMSRIHVQIGYDPLDEDSRRQIWDGYFKKLSKNHNNDGQEIRCSYDAKEFVRKSDDLRALRWNGREIRNAFQTAVALACFQAKQEGNPIPELTDDHLRQVVNMSHNFKSYVKAVRGKEEDYAYAAGVRNDTTRSSGRSDERLKNVDIPNF
ncbi:ATPase, AAA-type, core [Penicillium expansum]|uniref:ATPase, AAA-type, core n=1 Tax=Penicillium expansum TaxID=27334 RepID=A0A0A2K8P8_PENEN|nr:ATPase, AAA-type, core [Penicillium expansum]KGO42033.1 ATPase, AAA-type, core [Penicillium expansum]KGO63278.1 ATPase, AAA-type, core [Penicillium expansum]